MNRRPFYLYVDEFQNFATDSFAVILSEARKYGLNLTVANQYVAQMTEQVRDAVLAAGYDVFDGVNSVEQAKKKVLRNLDTIRKIAQKEIHKNGYDYPVAVRLEKTFFDTRRYRDFTLPAGEYEALRIVIGKGEGHNWWCVMFPALCLAASGKPADTSSLSEEEKRLILSNPKIEVRFKCVEIYEKIKKML